MCCFAFSDLPTVTATQQSYSVALDDQVTLGCLVAGTPTPTAVIWEFTNQAGTTLTPAIDGVKYSGSTMATPSLTIRNADTSDHGNYVCKATNSVGTGTSDPIYLYVTGGMCNYVIE